MQNTWILVSRRSETKIFEVVEPFADEIRLLWHSQHCKQNSFHGNSPRNLHLISQLEQSSELYASLILVAEDSKMAELRALLGPKFQERVIGGVPLDLYDAENQDILEAVRPILDLQKHRQEYAA